MNVYAIFYEDDVSYPYYLVNDIKQIILKMHKINNNNDDDINIDYNSVKKYCKGTGSTQFWNYCWLQNISSQLPCRKSLIKNIKKLNEMDAKRKYRNLTDLLKIIVTNKDLNKNKNLKRDFKRDYMRENVFMRYMYKFAMKTFYSGGSRIRRILGFDLLSNKAYFNEKFVNKIPSNSILISNIYYPCYKNDIKLSNALNEVFKYKNYGMLDIIINSGVDINKLIKFNKYHKLNEKMGGGRIYYGETTYRDNFKYESILFKPLRSLKIENYKYLKSKNFDFNCVAIDYNGNKINYITYLEMNGIKNYCKLGEIVKLLSN